MELQVTDEKMSWFG